MELSKGCVVCLPCIAIFALVVVLLVVAFLMRRAREHRIAQAVEVIEDAVGVGFGEVQVLLGAQRTLTVQ